MLSSIVVYCILDKKLKFYFKKSYFKQLISRLY
jgi:hypothetical protein